MKFPYDKVKTNIFSKGIVVKEFHDKNNPFPLDACLVEMHNDNYPWKKNLDFHEMLFVVSGNVEVEFENGVVEKLKENDVFIIEPNVYHKTSGVNAKIFVACNPPFDIKNVIPKK